MGLGTHRLAGLPVLACVHDGRVSHELLKMTIAWDISSRERFMITIRLSTEVKEDRRVVLNLPPETLVGEADLVVTIEPRRAGAGQGGSVRRHFGAVHSGDPRVRATTSASTRT